jgi:TetR/AcrR family transcriptional regulator, regulator of cefoperazone and chloramphenicol sensitivity
MKSTNHLNTDTRHRILEAAGDVFAESGFRDATVREICKHAGANLAAICYHFGDKEGLYFEVLRYWHDESMRKYPMDSAANDTLPPEERLRNFIRLFLLRILDDGKPAWFEKLFAKELMEPTVVFDRLLHEIVRPFYRVLESIIEEILGDPVGEETMLLCCESIISQCLRYKVKPVITRMFQQDLYSQEGVARVADHITRFSLMGLKHLLKDSEKKRAKGRTASTR